MQTKEKLDFSWGDTRGLRSTILAIYPELSFPGLAVENYGYPPEEGDAVLVQQLKELTKTLTGREFKNICVSSGCTNAVMASIYAMKDSETESVVTRELYFPRYPTMISIQDLLHIPGKGSSHSSEDIAVIDTPSNPLGLSDTPELNTRKIIWDAAYHTPAYGSVYGDEGIKDAQIFCGSLSKLTGINGLRLGWTATDNDLFHDYCKSYIRNTVCGVSYPSQELAVKILSKPEKLDLFFSTGNRLINSNREEVLRLKKIFGSDEMPKKGMFAFYEVDRKMKELFDKAMVKFTDGKECGSEVDAVRINLANPNWQTKEMVDRILKIDRA